MPCFSVVFPRKVIKNALDHVGIKLVFTNCSLNCFPSIAKMLCSDIGFFKGFFK